ncbi:restriction endonuclease [Brachybacterium sp. EF45031]|uniref:NaeI family type II restriction endonuclease n=1 Tax=Brachybacterium sillae TaxID=2810536 RepID=UPI00217CDC67|nr:NaeI family type II restriction endonuclease [Brachybacterium sillae]MCS6710805.1 restriction endonuclease [Brachybacterium sillae]
MYDLGFYIPGENVDVALSDVVTRIHEIDPDGLRTARTFRATFDQLYDGQRTGRYRVDQLFKTEKTHFGTLIEINLQREFNFESGTLLDYRIAGHEVDCKFSLTSAWMLPPESFEQLVLVCTADDSTSRWSMGIVRVRKEFRRTGANRDRKTGLNKEGRDNITWIFRNNSMPPNILLQLPDQTTRAILSHGSGQKRVNELFRRALNRRITRNVVATVARQEDYMKRVRNNGGARSTLRSEGIIILSGDYSYQVKLAESLRAQVPRPGEFVSIRVSPSSESEGVQIDGSYWKMENATDASPVMAPLIRGQ